MLRKSLLFIVLLSMAVFTVYAQESAEPVGIDALCGDGALSITALDELPEDATTQALDLLLRQFVTLPTEDSPALSFFNAKPPAPGAVIYFDSPEGRFFRAIGVNDVVSCAALNPTTPFPIGSNTKMMTAAVIYQLHEEGLISTSDLVSQYLPDEIALFAGAESITIDMMLGHTSGLPDYLNSKNPATLGGRMEAGEWTVLEMAFTPQELIANAANNPLLFTPGAAGQWSYSNTGYIMLGLIIEQVTGQGYIEAVTERIIDRLGLQNTVLVADSPPVELGLATQYLASPFTVNTSGWNFSQAWSAGNAVSTPEDMAIFLRAYYSGALYRAPSTLEAMMGRAAPGYAQESDNFYYMHGGYYKHGFLGHGGQTLGTESDVGYNPALDVVIVTWANASESYTGQGVYHVGHALGLTPTFDENVSELMAGTTTMPTVTSLAIEDVIGITFNSSGLFLGQTQEFKQPADGTTYSITFAENGQATVVADCNTVTASYTLGDDGAIQIELGASTLMACPGESMASDMLDVLSQASTVTVTESDGVLTLLLLAEAEGSSVGFTGSRTQ